MTPTSKPAVTPEMVEKARLTEQERIALFTLLQQWSRNQELQAQKVAEWIEVRAASAVQDAVSALEPWLEHDELCRWWHAHPKRESSCTCGLAVLREKYGVKE